MKITFIGGGSHRFASTARTLLAAADLQIDEIALYDINKTRADAVASFIEKTPEFTAKPCRILRSENLETALEQADLVCIVIFANDPRTLGLVNQACGRHGFMSNSWPMSPGCTLRAPKVCSIVLDIAQKMERLCPDAWLLDFSNPVSVASGIINHHTKIKGFGICEGFSNHLWDISRLFGKDEMALETDTDMHCAGVNHFSFVSPKSLWKGRNLYQQLDELIAKDNWNPAVLAGSWSNESKMSITGGLEQLLLGYKRYGYLLFSSEADGLASMNVSGFAEPYAKRMAEQSDDQVEEMIKIQQQERHKSDQKFSALINMAPQEMDWNQVDAENPQLKKKIHDLMVLMARAKSGKTVRVATSVPNNGAIKNLPDRFIVEFSQVFENGQMRPSIAHELPTPWYSWISAFAAHQTLLADAIACDCPETLFQALSCYPVNRDSTRFWKMWREVVEISKDDISPNLAKVIDLLPKV